jgi:hypothetical protein
MCEVVSEILDVVAGVWLVITLNSVYQNRDHCGDTVKASEYKDKVSSRIRVYGKT